MNPCGPPESDHRARTQGKSRRPRVARPPVAEERGRIVKAGSRGTDATLKAMRRSWRIAAIVLFTVALALGGLLGDRLLAVTDETRDSLRLYTELVNVAHDRYGGGGSYKAPPSPSPN